MHDLVLKMKLRIFTPGDYVCRSGEVAREMYVINNGKIEVVGWVHTRVIIKGKMYV